MDQYLDRLKYALEARGGGDMFIIARTNAYKSTEGVTREAAVERLQVALELGVDAVYVDGAGENLPPDEAKEELLYFRKAIPNHIPFMILGFANSLSVQEFEEVGHNIIVYPGGTVLAVFDGDYRYYKGVKDRGRPDFSPKREQEMTLKLRHEVCRFPEWWAIEDASTLKYEKEAARG